MVYDEEHMFEFEVIKACTDGKIEVIEEYLKSNKANTFLHTGWTPLLYAASSAQADVIHLLLKNNGDVNRHRGGYTPLMALCNCAKGTVNQRIDCLKILIQAGANVNAINKHRQTALMLACINQELEFVTELLKHAKNVNKSDNRKRTALMYATIFNKPDVVKLLIDNAANITLTDYQNLTVSDIASMKGYDKIHALFNSNEEEELNTCEVAKMCNWKDMFPSLISVSSKTIDFDVFTILNGMSLDQYCNVFQGMKLKQFLTLTEKDLSSLGINTNAHNVQFMEHLCKFHRKQWSVRSIGSVNTSLPYTLYNGIITLGIVSKQVAIIGSSFRYIANSLEANQDDIDLSEEQVADCETELRKAQGTLNVLKRELKKIGALSKSIQKRDDISCPPIYIGPRREMVNWKVLFNYILIVGICVSGTVCYKRSIF